MGEELMPSANRVFVYRTPVFHVRACQCGRKAVSGYTEAYVKAAYQRECGR